MADNLHVQIKILDYWIHDSYQFGKNMTCYILMQVGYRLTLIEKEL